MKLLRELFKLSDNVNLPLNLSVTDKYQHNLTTEEVDDIVDLGPDYVPMQTPTKKVKKKARNQPTTDAAQNQLIQSLWFYNNSDAS